MAQDTLLLTAVYEDVGSALADLGAFEQLHKKNIVGKYDAAVVANRDGASRIAKRMDRPRVRLIPELLGAGTLPGKDLKAAAQRLSSGQAALIVVGEPTLENGFAKAVTRASRTFSCAIDGAYVLSDELIAAVGS